MANGCHQNGNRFTPVVFDGHAGGRNPHATWSLESPKRHSATSHRTPSAINLEPAQRISSSLHDSARAIHFATCPFGCLDRRPLSLGSDNWWPAWDDPDEWTTDPESHTDACHRNLHEEDHDGIGSVTCHAVPRLGLLLLSFPSAASDFCGPESCRASFFAACVSLLALCELMTLLQWSDKVVREKTHASQTHRCRSGRAAGRSGPFQLRPSDRKQQPAHASSEQK